ncbi:isopentenyl-diphosphate Delta-isomerase [Longispora fulva]|uniref:Isopentenyl-diphosphate delta-isomerase n=1 Tax=Longispora fulva TaxID=619741 RepID=A0A8J7GS84_9ACTN|nr:isopentenyl-diphosphate Delta-isomerase [Longispora fulva]MBG6137293.1 isopentenyl-diphosphate delta-isomerase [Longispora fulva]GIG61353.1 isopentenyl-diphosphate Delta-isomerase [Longispora fulva]
MIMVELVDEAGTPTGEAEKLAAHVAPGRLHRAFSVFLFDAEGRMLLQRRADGKYHSPGVLSNACCGHPLVGEDPAVSAARRTVEELGVEPPELTPAGTVTYHLELADAMTEREYNHLFVGRLTGACRPDPAEVSEVRFVTRPELEALGADALSRWFPVVWAAASAALPADLATWRPAP